MSWHLTRLIVSLIGPDGSNNFRIDVRREKALVHSGEKSRPGTGSLHPVAIRAVVEVTKPLKPLV
jgi:hypothetical protein